MRVTFRSKLFAIVGSAALGFFVLAMASSVLAGRVGDRLVAIRELHIPRVRLQPKLESDFERLKRAFQDAVAAHDGDLLEHTKTLRDELYRDLRSGGSAIDPVAAARVHTTVDAYFAAAFEVAKRMMAGDGGEGLVADIERMQARQAEAAAALQAASAVDAAALADAFDDVERAQAMNARFRVVTSVSFLVGVVLLSMYLSRGTIRSIDAIAEGLERVGRGKFDEPIRVTTNDELADIAERANRTADSLAALIEQRDAADRVKSLHAGLGLELRGELEPAEVARRALTYVTGCLQSIGGALYWLDEDKTLRLAGHAGVGDAAEPAFRLGSGLVGEAAQKTTLTIVEDPPKEYLRVKSGLGEGALTSLVFVPLRRGGRTHGVLELAFLRKWRAADTELVEGLGEATTIAMEIAHGAAATAQLLVQTQAFAKRLALQEEELRSTNEELELQQHELRSTNAHLERHARELEDQRVVLEERNVELGEARRRFEQKASELARVSAYKSQFLANMSHELRTPLNSMLLLSKLLAENEGGHLTEKQVEFAKTIHAAGSDLLALINQVLDLAKVEAGKQEVRIGEVRIHDVASRASNVFGPLAKRKSLELEIAVEPDVPETIATDGRRLTQILNNLLGNAIKFTERGKVALRVFRPGRGTRFRRGDLEVGGTVAFSVTDTGIGIASEHQERIFAPFEQVDGASARSHGGTGLGLAIARELAVLLGGDLVLESAPTAGSTFTCYLPIVGKEPKERPPSPPVDRHFARQPREGGGVPDAAPLSLPSAVRFDGRSVLLVDDDMRTVYALSAALRAQGIDVVVADTGVAALAALDERPDVDAVLMDIMMPEMDGYEAMRRIRAQDRFRTVPIIALTAKAMKDDRAKCVDAGATDYLPKPVDAARLLALLERALSAEVTS